MGQSALRDDLREHTADLRNAVHVVLSSLVLCLVSSRQPGFLDSQCYLPSSRKAKLLLRPLPYLSGDSPQLALQL